MYIKFLKNKKRIAIVSILMLTTFFLIIPSSLAYGTSFADALIIRNGEYYETLDYNDDSAFYKVFCRARDSLQVTLSVNYPTYNLNPYLYNSSYILVDSSTDAATNDYVEGDPSTRGFFYIEVRRSSPSIGPIPFRLIISGTTGLAGIPGFEIISLLIGVISIIFLIYLKMRRQIRGSNYLLEDISD